MYLIIFGIVFTIYFAIGKFKYYRKYKMPPRSPGWLPLIGHLHHLLGKNQEVITDPDDAKTVANMCLGKDYMYDLAKSWLGNGLATGDVSTWKKHRKLLNQGFAHQSLVGFLGLFNGTSKQLYKDFDAHIGKPFDPQTFLIENSLKAICQTATGIDPKKHRKLLESYPNYTIKYFDLIIKRLIQFWFYVDFIFSLSTLKQKLDEVIGELHHCTTTMLQMRKLELLREAKNQMTTGNVKPIMDLMLETAKENRFTDEDIRSELDTLLFAGHDTTGTTLAFALLLLGSYPEVQERAYKEISDVFGDSHKDLDNSDLSKLVYLESLIKETIRLYPIGPVVARVADTDVKLRNYTVPAGSSFAICIWGIHRHSLCGDEPDAFRPERWLDPVKLPELQKIFFGFSWGKRGCIGKSYAMMSMKISLAHIIRRYTIKADVNKLRLKIESLLKPVAGNEIVLDIRK